MEGRPRPRSPHGVSWCRSRPTQARPARSRPAVAARCPARRCPPAAAGSSPRRLLRPLLCWCQAAVGLPADAEPRMGRKGSRRLRCLSSSRRRLLLLGSRPPPRLRSPRRQERDSSRAGRRCEAGPAGTGSGTSGRAGGRRRPPSPYWEGAGGPPAGYGSPRPLSGVGRAPSPMAEAWRLEEDEEELRELGRRHRRALGSAAGEGRARVWARRGAGLSRRPCGDCQAEQPEPLLEGRRGSRLWVARGRPGCSTLNN